MYNYLFDRVCYEVKTTYIHLQRYLYVGGDNIFSFEKKANPLLDVFLVFVKWYTLELFFEKKKGGNSVKTIRCAISVWTTRTERE